MEECKRTYKYAVWFSVNGDMRFLSHRDTITLWQRALVRGRLPVRYSGGFNPQIRISLPLPRSVGMASDGELAVIELSEDCQVAQVMSSLAAQVPEGVALRAVRELPPALKPRAQWADYRLQLHEGISSESFRETIASFLKLTEHVVVRPARGRHPRRKLNIRPYVQRLGIETDAIELRVDLRDAVTPRMEELCRAIDLDPVEHLYEIRRCRMAFVVGPDAEDLSMPNDLHAFVQSGRSTE